MDGSISSSLYIINSHEWFHIIKQAKKLEYFFGDIQSDRLGSKDEKNIATDAEDHSKNKYEQKHRRDYVKRLKYLDNCEDLFFLVWEFVIDHINKIKVKELRVFLQNRFG